MQDPYLYESTNVLKNKFNIKNEKDLSEMEAEYTSLNLREIEENPVQGNYDFEHLCKIHKYIFQDIYDWAGIPRTINMEKPEIILGGISIEYSDAKDIESTAIEVIEKMKYIKWDRLNIDEKADKFSKSMAELWKIHSFREGNTRTVVTFCSQFAESKGFPLDRTLFEKHSDYVRTALVAANANFKDLGDKSKPEYLIKIVKDSIERGSSLIEKHKTIQSPKIQHKDRGLER